MLDLVLFVTLRRWDEWVPESRLLKFSEENLLLQKKLIQDNKELTGATSTSKAQKASASAISGRTTTASGRKEGTRGTKRGREEVRRQFISFSFISDATS